MNLAQSWTIWLDDPFGQRLALLDNLSAMRLARIANDTGAFEITISPEYDALIRQDCIVEFWRTPQGGAAKFVSACFIRKFRRYQAGGMELTMIAGPDQNELLKTRIVAYPASSAYAKKSDYADDMAKEIVRQNLGSSATDTDRRLPAVFTVAADTGSAPLTDKSFSYRDVLRVVQDLTDASWQAGTALYFDVVPLLVSDSQIGFEFRTYIDQPGADRTETVFGLEFGNLTDAELELDYTGEKTVVYVGGQGLGEDRDVVEREDAERAAASYWNRREAFYNASGQVSTTSGLEAAGDVQLALSRPRLRFSGRLLDTDQTRYGVDWEHGDRVAVTYRGFQADGVIRSTEFALTGRGGEQINSKLELEALL